MQVIAIGCGMCHTYLMHQKWVGRPLSLADRLSTFIGLCGGRLKDIYSGASNVLARKYASIQNKPALCL